MLAHTCQQKNMENRSIKGMGRGFSNSWTCWVFFAWKSVIVREFFLKIDTSLAIARSGLRTNLLFEKPPFRKPPHSMVSKTNSSFSAKLRKICAHAHSRKPHPNILHKFCRCSPAQISHNLSTFSDAPAHLSHNFSGICRRCPAHNLLRNFLGYMGCSQNLPLYKQWMSQLQDQGGQIRRMIWKGWYMARKLWTQTT